MPKARRGVTLEVEGLRDLTKALRQVERESPKEVSKAHKDIAQRLVPDIRTAADARPRKTRTGQLARTVRAGGTQRQALIRVGNKSRPDAFVQEFGGRAPLFGNRERWNTVRAQNRRGYFLYPTIRRNRDRISREYLAALDEAVRRYFSRR